MKKIISILLLSVVAWSMVWADDNPLYNIVCKQNDRGIVTTSPVRQAHQFDKVTLNAVPYEGYKLYRFVIRLLPGETTIPSGSNIQGEHYFYMPNNDVEVSADFVPADYNIFIDQKPLDFQPNSFVSISPKSTYLIESENADLFILPINSERDSYVFNQLFFDKE